MMGSARRLLMAVAWVLVSSSFGFAQGGNQSLAGVVVDSGGGVIPGATVVVKNNATGETFQSTSNEAGAFSVPAIVVGTYTVTVTLQGFKTAVVNDVRVVTGTPASVKAVLEVGALAETVEVRSGAELIQTQSTAVTSHISVEQISELPLSSRNALYFAAMLPGVETSGGPRGSTFSGLPQNTINITIDGVTTGNGLQSTDGFFSMVTPRLDAVEEVTVTGATAEATGGRGAVQIAFTTRSGTNEFVNSIYHYFKHPDLNSNYYFNKINGLEKNKVIAHQYGGRSGGPIIIPGLFNGRNKAFYFFNMEHLHQPNEATRTRTILNSTAQSGTFQYLVGGQLRTVPLLQLAAANGHTSTIDPTISALLNEIRAATNSGGTVSAPPGATNVENYVFLAPSTGNQYAPTTRLDVNLTDSHRLTGTYWWQRFLSKPDLLNNAEPVFPGFPNQGFQTSYRTTGSLGLRSTLGSNLVNEVKGGWQWSPNNFFGNITKDMFDNQGGYLLDFPLISDPGANNNPAPRNTVNWNIDNTVSWLKGAHSYSFGGSFEQVTHNQNGWNAVPSLAFGVDQNGFDPANAMFSTLNFPGASTAQLNEARNVYAILTGRVTQIGGTARLDADSGQYVYLGNLFQRSRREAYALYAQDSWRLTPALTVNYGVRYDLHMPFTVLTNTWSLATLEDVCGVSGVGSGPGGRECNLFQPGTIGAPGYQTAYDEFEPRSRAYKTDWNNFGPNVGVAWRPDVREGFLRALLGDPDQATIRASYGLTYSVERMDRFTGLVGGNPGGSVAATRNYTTGFPLAATGPVLFRERGRLGPPAFPQAPQYPIQAVASNSVNAFDKDLVTPYVHAYSVGLQRSLGKDMALEVRYVGNRNKAAWTTENWNEPVIFENAFIDEFRRAQDNLAAHVAQGCAAAGNCSFAYRGPGTGTSPLPIFLAYMQGLPASRATDAAAYTNANFRSTSYTGLLGYYEPSVGGAAGALHQNLTFRANAITAGLPANFFVVNPSITNANITKSLAGTKYDSVQLQLRRRLANGLFVEGNYTYSTKVGSNLLSLRKDRVYLANSSTQQDVPHSFKMQWIYEVPLGRGKRFGANMHPVLNAVIGNWEFSGAGVLRRNLYSLNGLRLVGMSAGDLQDVFKIRVVKSDTGTTTVYSMPQDIIDNTRRAFSTDPTSATGYSADGAPSGRYLAPASTRDCIAVYLGDCGSSTQINVLGPVYSRWDMRLNKRFPFARKASVEFIVEVQNVFDSPNFNHALTPGETANAFRVTSAYTDINTTFDPGGRLGQLAWRISW